MNDPVVHDQHLNQSFRSDIPKKGPPDSTSVKVPWVSVVPKFTHIRGVQLDTKVIGALSRLHRWESGVDADGRDYLIVPAIYGDTRAFKDCWILIADDDWDRITVCTPESFTMSYEVKSK